MFFARSDWLLSQWISCINRLHQLHGIATTSCKSTWDTVPYFCLNGLSMILCLWSSLHPLSKLLALQDHAQNFEEQLWMVRGEEGGECYISQTCDKQRFEVEKVSFSWKCLNIFATGCSTSRKSFPVPFNQEGEVPFLSFSTPVPTPGIFCSFLPNTLANHQCLPHLA